MLNELLLPPTDQQFGMLAYLILFMLLFALPYLGLVLVSTLASTGLRMIKSPLDRYFLEPWTGGGPMITFGVIPFFCLMFLFQLYFYGSSLPVFEYFLRIMFPLFGGFLLVYLYGKSRAMILVGLGFVLLLAAAFFTISTIDLMLFPEIWAFVETPLPAVFSIQVIIHFLIFLALSILFTGAWLYFLYFRWPEHRRPTQTFDYDQMRKITGGMMLGGVLFLPVLMLWDFYTLPVYTLTSPAFALGAVTIVLLGVLALAIVGILRATVARFAVTVMVLATIVFGLVLVNHQLLYARANQEHLTLLADQVKKEKENWTAEREAKRDANVVADEKLGEKIYNERCTACHLFEQRVVGPPYNEVLPKYVDNVAALEAFIRNPVKVNPDYPAMPNQGLNVREVKAVSAYLLSTYAAKE
ncbi:MAG: cytochrome c [Acidobacteria bacterium]|nr:cytochrome c [Acidobacteriota bacterium]